MLINLGRAELSDGHLEQAELFCNARTRENPEQPFALLNLAAIALKRNDLPTAQGFLERAQRNPLSLAQAEEMLALVKQKKRAGSICRVCTWLRERSAIVIDHAALSCRLVDHRADKKKQWWNCKPCSRQNGIGRSPGSFSANT
jgi:hypothetical protein